MTPHDQIKALAELDGWEFLKPHGHERNYWLWNNDIPIAGDEEGFDAILHVLPPYLTSRDAIVPVIEKCLKDPQIAHIFFLITTQDMLQAKYGHPLFATPAQLCEALLRSVGKWKD